FKGVPSYSDTKVQEVNLNIAWSLESVNFSFLAQYQDLDIFQQQDNTNWRTVPPPDVARDFLEFNPVAWSTEIRADGELGERLNYVSGLIYSEDDTDTINSINSINILGGSTTEAFGVYTNWTYRISDQWDTSLGGRWSRVSYNATVFGFIPGLGELNAPYKEVYRDPSYSFKIQYYPAEDVQAYFAYDTAFRSGGINVLAPLAGDLAAIFSADPVRSNLLAINQDYLEFTQEDSESFELGLKGTFLEQRLRWNTSLFLQIYDDHQYRTSPSDGAVTATLSGALSNLAVNVEEVEVYGVETEFNFLIDENWSAFFTAAYAKPEIQEYSKRMCEEGEAEDSGTLICPGKKGEPLNDEPEFHVLAQLFYEYPLGMGDLELFGNVTAEYLDKPFQRVKTPNLRDITTYDATLGVRAGDGKWSFRVWCKNITDEVVLPSEGVQLQEPAGGGGGAHRLLRGSARPAFVRRHR
ncbi:MAG: TonB-dependent receptor, partial [Halioglobus sp.]|nr:TonB-dependent receptor [Halioglobus sp.]